MDKLKHIRFWVALGISMLLTACSAPSYTPQTVPDDSLEQIVAEESGSTMLEDSSEREVARESVAVLLDDYGLAPEIENEVWLNTQGPLRLADLRGSVVLLEMWTFG